MEKGEKSGKATESVFRGGWPRQVGSGNKGKIHGISAPNSQWPLPVRAGLEQTLSAEQGFAASFQSLSWKHWTQTTRVPSSLI